jgi:S1-C subfamily serine protease
MLLSAAHVIADGNPQEGTETYGTKTILVMGFRPGTETVEYSIPAKVVSVNPKMDWVVMELERTHPAMWFSQFSDNLPRLGEDVWCVGSPLLDAGTLTKGIVSHPQRTPSISEDKSVTYIHSDATVLEGNSGGGMFRADGVCVGIVVRRNGLNSSAYALSTRYIHESMHESLIVPDWIPQFVP